MKVVFFFLCTTLLCFSQSPIEKAKSLLNKKDYSKAEQLIGAYLDQYPDDLEGQELLGDSYSYQNQWENSIDIYKSLVDKQPLNATYHYKYGGALAMQAQRISKFRALGLIGPMKRAFLKAAELDPKHIDVRWALVDMYVTLPGIVGGSHKKALKYAKELEALSKVDGYLAKGYVYEYDDQSELAELNYKNAVKVGGSVTCFEKLTGFYVNQDKPEKAISTIENAQVHHKRNALHYQIGKVCADYNIQLDKGIMCLKTYINNYSSADGVPKEWAYYRLAQLYRHKRNKKEALKWIDKSLSINGDFGKALKERQEISRM